MQYPCDLPDSCPKSSEKVKFGYKVSQCPYLSRTLFFSGTDGSDSAVSLVVQAPPNTPSVSPLKQQLSHPAKSAAAERPNFGRSTSSGPSSAAATAAAVSKGAPPPIPPRGVQAASGGAGSQHVSTTYITQDEVG